MCLCVKPLLVFLVSPPPVFAFVYFAAQDMSTGGAVFFLSLLRVLGTLSAY